MQRIHAPFDEPTLAQIDREVEKKGISRAQWLSSAIGSYLRLIDLTNGADPAEVAQELAQLRSTIKSLQSDCDSLQNEIQQLKASEENAREDVAQMAPELKQARITNESLWRESQKLKKAEESLREEVERAGRKTGTLEEQLAATLPELEKLRMDMILLKHDEAHYRDTIQQKDQQIAFLEAHVAQLTQSISQLALPPSQEEAKAKHWWQFWR
jgi:chromosome segregation ATPase